MILWLKKIVKNYDATVFAVLTFYFTVLHTSKLKLMLLLAVMKVIALLLGVNLLQNGKDRV